MAFCITSSISNESSDKYVVGNIFAIGEMVHCYTNTSLLRVQSPMFCFCPLIAVCSKNTVLHSLQLLMMLHVICFAYSDISEHTRHIVH